MRVLDYFLGTYNWWRRLRGGKWWAIRTGHGFNPENIFLTLREPSNLPYKDCPVYFEIKDPK